MGYVQDSPVSTSMISNECMIYHMKVHIVSYDLGKKKSFEKMWKFTENFKCIYDIPYESTHG